MTRRDNTPGTPDRVESTRKKLYQVHCNGVSPLLVAANSMNEAIERWRTWYLDGEDSGDPPMEPDKVIQVNDHAYLP